MGKQIKIFSRTIWIPKRFWRELTACTGLLIGIHVVYYMIQNNATLTPQHERRELFYVQWFKDKFPSLSWLGVDDSAATKRRDLMNAQKAEKNK
ncbi:hypothetical protein GPALN_012563 [Globodera pallida]|nr:hypothetical protein GPALN_012563 [Globodera pallida]